MSNDPAHLRKGFPAPLIFIDHLKTGRVRPPLMAGNRNSGRKPGPGGRKSRRVPVLLTPEEHARISAEAARLGLTLSAYLARAGIALTGTVLSQIPDEVSP